MAQPLILVGADGFSCSRGCWCAIVSNKIGYRKINFVANGATTALGFKRLALLKNFVTSDSDLRAMWKRLGSEPQDRFVQAFCLSFDCKVELMQGCGRHREIVHLN